MHLEKHPEELQSRRMRSRRLTARKPYFGDVEDMTYLNWASVELTYPWAGGVSTVPAPPPVVKRVSMNRIGTFSVFSDAQAAPGEPAAGGNIGNTQSLIPPHVAATDAAWFPQLSEYRNRFAFVPVIDGDLLLVGRDQLWQAVGSRYKFCTRIIPGRFLLRASQQ